MQILARKNVDGKDLSDDDVKAILTAPLRDASKYGAEILDLDGSQIGELSVTAKVGRGKGIIGGGGDLVGCTITHDTSLPAPTDCKIQVTRELDWENVRIRPWQQISGVKFYLGVYGLETPTQTPADGVWDVQGYSMLARLRVGITDTIVVPTNKPYLTAAREILDGAGIPGLRHEIATDENSTTPTKARVFALSTSNTELILDCVNDLLTAVGYTKLSMNESGVLVSVPHIPPTDRPSEWEFDLNDQDGPKKTSIVDVARSKKVEGLRQYNWWRFVRRGMPSAPSEGSGWYTPVPKPAGWVSPYFESVDVASQQALEAYGDARVVADTTQAVTLKMQSEPMPHLGLGVPDIATVKDDETSIDGRVRILSWKHDLQQATTEITAGVL